MPTTGRAANTCNAFIGIGYITAQDFHTVGDVLRVTITLGAGSI